MLRRLIAGLALVLGFAVGAKANVSCDICVSSVIAAGGDSTDSCANTPWDDSMDSVMQTFAAGDIVCVADDHAESTAGALTLTGPEAEGTNDPAIIVCVDVSTCTAGSCEVCGAGERASVTTTALGHILLEQRLFTYGVNFYSGNDFRMGFANSDCDITLEEGRVELAGTSTLDLIICGWNGPYSKNCTFNNVDVDFQNASQGFELNAATFHWNGGTLDSDANNLFELSTYRYFTVTVENVDLSLCDGNMVSTSGLVGGANILFSRSKLHASNTLISAAIDLPNLVVRSHQCQSGSVTDPPHQMQEEHYQGTIQVSTTNVRTGGATDGTTDFAWEFDTDTGSNYLELYEPLCSKTPIARWVSGGSEITATVYANGPANMNDDDFWPVWSLPPSDATSLGVRATNRTLPGEEASLTSDDSTWTTGTAYKFTQTFTPAEDGVVMVWPCVATDTSVTMVYFDALIDIQ